MYVRVPAAGTMVVAAAADGSSSGSEKTMVAAAEVAEHKNQQEHTPISCPSPLTHISHPCMSFSCRYLSLVGTFSVSCVCCCCRQSHVRRLRLAMVGGLLLIFVSFVLMGPLRLAGTGADADAHAHAHAHAR